MIQRVKKAEGKMSIEEDGPPSAGRDENDAAGGVQYGKIDPGERSKAFGRGRGGGHAFYASVSSQQQQRDPAWGATPYGGGAYHEPLQHGNDDLRASHSSQAGNRRSAWGGEDVDGRDHRQYPYHEQGDRAIPVPEI